MRDVINETIIYVGGNVQTSSLQQHSMLYFPNVSVLRLQNKPLGSL